MNAWGGRAESWFNGSTGSTKKTSINAVDVFCDPVCWNMHQSLLVCRMWKS